MIAQEQLPMVAVPSMNDTHLEEILIINKLDSAVKNSEILAIKEILFELIEHTSKHFSDEEKMMIETNFSEHLAHKAEHARHLNELHSLVKYFEKHEEPKAISAYIEGSLTPWLVHHVNTMDSTMAQFVQQRLMQ